MPVTIKDVARMSGVSISTVSRVINESKPVSEAIKERVLKIIEETGYVPNPVARSLVMKKSQLIGVIAPDLSDSMVGTFLNGIEEIARMYEYDSLVCTTYNDDKKLDYYINLLVSKQVAGIIMITSEINEHVNQKLVMQKIPTVYYSKTLGKMQAVNFVDIDKNKAFEMLIEDVKTTGKLAFLAKESDKTDQADVYDEKLIKKILDEKKISYEILRVSNDRDKCYKELLKKFKKEKFASVISTTDEKTLAAVFVAEDLSIAIPKQMKIAQLYDTKTISLIRPMVTSLEMPYYDIGAVCARMVVKQIGSKDKKPSTNYSNMILDAKIIKRESTK